MTDPIYTVCESATRLPITSRCPRCRYGPLDGATCVRAQSQDAARKNLVELVDPPVVVPAAGDISICWKCNAVLIYATVGEQLGIRAMNRKEVAQLKADRATRELIRRLRHAQTRVKKRGGA